jgi:hypothetical protein
MIDIEAGEIVRPDLSISSDAAFYILMKAREFDEKTPTVDPDSGSNPIDDGARDVLEDERGDAIEEELDSAVKALNDDAQLDLIALIWIGRGDFSPAEWNEAREAARDIGRARLPRYIRGIPLVSDYLDDALAQFGFSLEDYMEA